MAENFTVHTSDTPEQVARKLSDAGHFADARRILDAEAKRQRKAVKRINDRWEQLLSLTRDEHIAYMMRGGVATVLGRKARVNRA